MRTWYQLGGEYDGITEQARIVYSSKAAHPRACVEKLSAPGKVGNVAASKPEPCSNECATDTPEATWVVTGKSERLTCRCSSEVRQAAGKILTED